MHQSDQVRGETYKIYTGSFRAQKLSFTSAKAVVRKKKGAGTGKAIVPKSVAETKG